jgi:outer membrane protein
MLGIPVRADILRAPVLSSVFSCPAHAGSETLEQAWTQAYRNNPSLEAQRASLRATDEQVSQALANWRPSVDATGTYGKTWQFAPDLAPFENPTFDDKTRGLGAQVTQPLFRGFRTREATEAAEKQVLAGRAKLSSAEQQLFLDTASAYLGVLRDEAVLELERNHETVLEDKLKETRARSEAGELTGTDVRQAESRLARAHVSRYQAESTLTQDRASFARLVGSAPGQLQAPALILESPRTLADIFQAAETRNPEVVASQFAVEEADAEIKLNKGSLLPEVDLVGNTGRNWGQSITVPGREDSSQVLVQVTVPLYRSGTDYFAPSFINSSRRAAFIRDQRAAQAIAAAQAQKAAKPLPASGAAGISQPSPAIPTQFDSLIGVWQGAAPQPGLGMCNLRLELRRPDPAHFAGFPMLACMPIMSPFSKPSAAQTKSAVMSAMSPMSALLTGAAQGGSIQFSVDKVMGKTPSGCVLTSFTVTPFGNDLISAEWKEGACLAGEQRGQILLKRMGK